MLNIRLIRIFCLLTFPFISYGQNAQRQEISGKLLSTTKNLDLETIYVYNKQSNKGILSDASGHFKLSLHIGDTIVASAMQIEPVNWL